MDDRKREVAVLLLVAGLGVAQHAMSQIKTRDIEVDFARAVGTIKALNGVNGGPLCERGWVDLSPSFQELGIKHVRLNDVAWTFDDALNINYVFPHFEADPDRPESYDFLQTDWYLKFIKALGIEMIYDLGPTAEYPKLPPRHVDPPQDFGKWAKICLNVIKHYNDGWANGQHYNIKYWEIWNEPDVQGGPWVFWNGTPEQYYRLYETAAKAIKNYDPSLKVGGPALTTGTPLLFLQGFLEYCRNHKAPVDFVSWHWYSDDPPDVIVRAAKIRELLNKYGYPNAESVVDEWSYWPAKRYVPPVSSTGRKPTHVMALNYMGDPDNVDLVAQEIQGMHGATFDASVLMSLQDSTVNAAEFYHGATIVFWGLFNEHGVPKKTYYAFKAFKTLLDTPQRVVTGGSDPSGLTAMAGMSQDKTQATVLISNYGTECSYYNIRLNNLPWKDGVVYEKYVLDKNHYLELVKTETLVGASAILPEQVEVPSVCLVRLKASSHQ